MNLNQFNEQYSDFRLRQKVSVLCSSPGCNRTDTLNKDSAIRNIQQHGVFLCRTCCYTDEGREKISVATSYKRSEETKLKMAEAKKAYFRTPEGKALKRKLSWLAAKGHSENKYENSKRTGWYLSTKNNGLVFYGSSYELRLCWELDRNDGVKSYETQICYQVADRSRCLDCLVTHTDGSIKAIEVKPRSRLNEQANIDQINDAKSYASDHGYNFELVTEDTFKMTEKEIRDWADEFRSQMEFFDWVGFRQEQDRIKAKKHYDKCIAVDLVTVECKFCDCTHEALRLTYDKNVARNGRYICEREGGHIAGSKPKPKKVDPLAEQGLKKCNICVRVLPLESFSAGKCVCKECRAKIYAEKYQQKKKANL